MKNFIVQEDSYILILKYVESNPLRAKIVKDAIKYKYSSAYNRINNIKDIIDTPPIILLDDWYNFINEKENKVDIELPLGS